MFLAGRLLKPRAVAAPGLVAAADRLGLSPNVLGFLAQALSGSSNPVPGLGRRLLRGPLEV